jgi:hypothetical protein
MCCISCIHSSLGLLVIKHCFVLMKLKVVTIRGHGAGPSSVLETISQGSFSKFVARNHGTDPLSSPKNFQSYCVDVLLTPMHNQHWIAVVQSPL